MAEMSEHTHYPPIPLPHIPKLDKAKRDSLNKIGKITLAGLLTLGGANEEVKAKNEGINTPYGKFWGVYENHSRGIESIDIPERTDIFWEEFQSRDLYNLTPQQLLNNRFVLGSGGSAPLFKDSILKKLIDNQVAVAFGDTTITDEMLKRVNLLENIRLWTGMTTLAGAGYVSRRQEGKVDNDNLISSSAKCSRRIFVRNILGVTGLVLSVPLLTDEVNITKIFQDNLDARQEDTLSRILFRLEGLSRHAKPENPQIFFRNLLTANKLLTLAEIISKKLGKKVKTVFNNGASHNGIEDFLRLGQNFCRELIAVSTDDFLREVIVLNGGLENFCTIRIISMPKEISVADIREGRTMNNIVDDKIIDTSLYKKLAQKHLFA